MTKWYYSDYERNRHGPVGAADLAALHASGQLAADTLVWREGLAQWQPWRSLMGEIVPPAAAAPAAASRGAAIPDAWAAEPHSPYAPPRAAVHRAAEVYHDAEVVYAGFWKRTAAYLIDMVILSILGAAVGGAVGGLIGAATGASGTASDATGFQLLVQLAAALAAACYYGWFYASLQRATPGKLAIGIKVVRGDGTGCGFWRGFARYFAMIPSGLILGIGFLMAGFTQRKQALHDLICDTVVVDKWAFTAEPERQREELGTVAAVVLALGALLLVGFVVLVFAGIGALAGAH